MKVSKIKWGQGKDLIERGDWKVVNKLPNQYNTVFYVDDGGSLEMFAATDRGEFHYEFNEEETEALAEIIKTRFLS